MCLVVFVLWCAMAASCTEPPVVEPVTEQVTTDASGGKDISAVDVKVSDADATDKQTERNPEKVPTCVPGTPVVPTKDFFTDVTEQSGLYVEAFLQNPTKKVPINDHSRLGFVDINGDGFPDIVAHSLYPNAQAGVPFQHRVYLNNGDGTFKHFSDESGLRNVQAGFFAFADVDNDGDQDCFAGLDIALAGQTNQIYLNDGKGRFTKKANSGVDLPGKLATNAIFADFNNDGKIDLYIGAGGTSFRAPEALFFGNGDGTFVNQTSKLAGNTGSVSNGSVACDYDNDGDLDIFVSVYGVSSNFGKNLLWKNDGKGNFVNVAQQAKFDAQPTGNYFLASTGRGGSVEPGKQPGSYVGSNGFGIDCKDVNNDGLMDVLLATISHPNEGTYSRKWSDPTQLLINQGPGKQFVFRNEFLLRKLPFNEGDIDAALVDFDNDGRLDISITRDNKYERNYTTDAQKAWLGLYHQLPSGAFADLGLASGINKATTQNSASLTECTDDSTCTNGEKCLSKRCRQPCVKHSDCKSKDDICGSFWDTTKNGVNKFCRAKLLMKGGQNLAWADIDQDGDLDLLVGGRDKGGGRPNFLFRNDIGSKNRWLGLRLVGDGVKVNRDAIGARVTLVTGSVKMLREVQSSRGTYNSIDTRSLHFGLAGRPCEFTLEVRWPDGTKASIPSSKLKENRYWTLTYPDQMK
jgi:hypothetical protein